MSNLRSAMLDRLDGGAFDAVVIGAGVNGAVAAASLAGRGARVALVDRTDFAGTTSQSTSNLVWGGFKYLENYELRLVRKLCSSRNRLMRAYPTNVHEMRFLTALGRGAPFPTWLAALGTVGYWGIGSFTTAAPRYLSRSALQRREPVIGLDGVRAGIEFSDALLVDSDARFVFGFVRDALDSGATVANYVEVVGAERADGVWRLELNDGRGGGTISCTTPVVVNASGPFVVELNRRLGVRTRHRIVHSKGVHLVVDRITPHDRVIAMFDDDQRFFFVIPMGNRSMIGTTDDRVDDPRVEVTESDRRFLLDQINDRLDLERPLTTDDIIAERCGTRPLVIERADQADDDWTSLSRKHVIEVDPERNVISVLGGKLTDCLNAGEDIGLAAGQLGVPLMPDTGRWFGEPSAEIREVFDRQAAGLDLDVDHEVDATGSRPSERLWRRYGRRAFDLLDDIREDPSMRDPLAGSGGLIRAELRHAAGHELVETLDDFLRRRTSSAQLTRHDELAAADWVVEAAAALFGAHADEELTAYFESPARPSPHPTARQPTNDAE